MPDNANLDRGTESIACINFHKFQALIYVVFFVTTEGGPGH